MYKEAIRPAWAEINLSNLDYNIKNIMKKAEGLLVSAANHYGEDNYSCGSGGFMAHLDGTTLTLQFILTEMTSYADDFINTED